MDTLGRRIARWAAHIAYEHLPPSTIHEVKRRVLDSIGCSLGAYASAPARIAREMALSAADASGASLWGTPQRCRPEYAAFANGAMVRYLDYNDTYLSQEPAHPSDNIPAAAAVAQAAGLGGRDLILATVIGYELQCRQCDAASLRAHGWDHVYYGALSTAVLAGKLWGLNEEQLEHAIGLAGVCNIATRQTRTGQISMWKACAFSNAARNGIFAADLARRGMTGPHEIYEGPKGVFNQLTGPFELELSRDDHFMIERTYIKFWPAEYHAQSAIDAMLQIRPQLGGRAVKSIHIDSFEAAVSIIGSEREKWRPTSRETADHSMPYCVVKALLDGDVTLESFDESALADPAVLDLLDRTTIAEDASLNDGYPEGIPNRVSVILEDERLEKRVDFPRGHARNPMTDEEVVAKFRRLAEGVVSDATAERIVAQCLELDRLADLAPLFEFEVETS